MKTPIIILADHESAKALAWRMENHAKKTGRPVPPTPPRRYEDLGTGEDARRSIHIPSRDSRAIDAILEQMDLTPAPTTRKAATAARRA